MLGKGALDIRRLEILRAVASKGSFAAAAEALAYTPSAISQQMSRLERDAGVTLFERTGRGVRLTDAGRALATHADAVLGHIVAAEAELGAMAGLRGGRFCFGSFTSATGVFAAQALETFRARFPAVELEFADGEPYESALRLKQRELDLALVFGFDDWPVWIDYDGRNVCAPGEVELLPLLDDPFLLVAPRDHPLSGAPDLSLRALDGERVLSGAPWAKGLRRACEAVGAEPLFDLSSRATGFEAFQALAAAGRGVTFMPQLALGWLQDGLVATPLEGAPVRHVSAAMPAGTELSPGAAAMLEIARELVAELDPARQRIV